MSNLQKTPRKKLIAILCGDIHLSHNAPRNRAEKKHNWYKAMANSLYQLRVKQEEHGCPIIMAGDIFDRWDSPAELINFAIKEMPDDVHAIPGQHDLPNHRLDLIHKSAYWTLVESGKIDNIPVGESYVFKPERLDVLAFPWGRPLAPYNGDCPYPDFTKLAVVHRYCYKKVNGNKSTGYKGAPQADEVQEQVKKLAGFDAAVFGDNHVRWSWWGPGINVVNCGTFMRRTITDKNVIPNVAYLYADGRIHTETIETDDKWLDVPVKEQDEKSQEIHGFIQKLLKAETDPINFKEMVVRMMNKKSVNPDVKEIILEALES